VHDASLTQRVRRLERAALALGALTLVAVAAAFTGQDAVPAELRARRVALVDGEGRVRAELALDADGQAGLFVRDEQGLVRARVVHDAEQSGLRVDDATGQTRLGAVHFAHGGTGLALHGPAGRGGAVLYLKDAGALTFYGADGEVLQRVAGE